MSGFEKCTDYSGESKILFNQKNQKQMKNLIAAIAIVVGISFTANAQTSTKEEMKQDKKMEMKDHVCSTSCKDGQHMYAHGEKGHTCGDECKKMMSKDTKMKDHTCSKNCSKGCCHIPANHAYSHGEKGHVCGKECKKKM